MPLDTVIYQQAVIELQKSCGKVCVDGLDEFNREYAGDALDVASLQGSCCLIFGLLNFCSQVALVKFGNMTARVLAEVLIGCMPGNVLCGFCFDQAQDTKIPHDAQSDVFLSRASNSVRDASAFAASSSPNFMSDIACAGAVGLLGSET